jgi:hypothetical protein
MTAKKNPHWSDIPAAPSCLPDPFGCRRDASVAISQITATGNIVQAKALRDFYIALANQCDFAAGGTGSAVAGGAP